MKKIFLLVMVTLFVMTGIGCGRNEQSNKELSGSNENISVETIEVKTIEVKTL